MGRRSDGGYTGRDPVSHVNEPRGIRYRVSGRAAHDVRGATACQNNTCQAGWSHSDATLRRADIHQREEGKVTGEISSDTDTPAPAILLIGTDCYTLDDLWGV